jgi:hypothetical protein
MWEFPSKRVRVAVATLAGTGGCSSRLIVLNKAVGG